MVITENLSYESGDRSKWKVEKWNGKGKINLGGEDFDFANAEVNVSYEGGGEEIYTIGGTLSSSNSLFEGDVEVSNMKVKKEENKTKIY